MNERNRADVVGSSERASPAVAMIRVEDTSTTQVSKEVRDTTGMSTSSQRSSFHCADDGTAVEASGVRRLR